jgi:hypothetical protein
LFQLAWVAGALIPVVLAVPSRTGYVVLALGCSGSAVAYLAGLAANTRHVAHAGPAVRPPPAGPDPDSDP